MKKFFIWYIVFSIIMFIALYTFTLYQKANQRSMDFFNELVDEAVTTLNPERFIKYQSLAYEEIANESIDGYRILLYHVILGDSLKPEDHLVFIIIPENDQVPYANEVKDLNDKTKLIIKHNEITIFNSYTDERYQNYAISYGIKEIGMYYYDVKLEEDLYGSYELYAYDGSTIINKIISLELLEEEISESTYSKGYTQDEKDELLNINEFVKNDLIMNMTLYLVIDIIVGAIIWFIIKKIAQQRA